MVEFAALLFKAMADIETMLWGAYYKMGIVRNTFYTTFADAVAAYPNATDWKEIPLLIPYAVGSGNPPTGKLFSGKDFQNAYASSLDAYAPNWQLSTIFAAISSTYEGTNSPNIADVLNLFPYAITLDGECTYYITADNVNAVIAMSVSDFAQINVFGFDKTTLANLSIGINQIPVITFYHHSTVLDMVGCNLVYNVKYTYNGKRGYNVGYATDAMKNCFTVLRAGSTTFNNVFFRAMQDEFIPPSPGPAPAGDDPYSGGGSSTTGGGTGTFSDTSTPIDFPPLPSVSAVDAGFITLYNPTLAQLNGLAAYLWSDLFDIATFKRIFADPMECILGLSIVPVAVPDGSTATITVGNVDTGVSAIRAASQYVELDCGTLDIKEFWGAYLDYSPYTKLELYLPYIGVHAIDADEVMGKKVHIKYHVDILTGACIAYVKCGESVLYSFAGQCSANIPVTSRDWTNTINGILGIATSLGSLVATGGANAPSAITNIASSAMNAVKPQIEKSGSLSGVGGMLAIQSPYLILSRPKQALPEGQNAFSGYPSYITVTLSEVTGYTEVDSIHPEGIPCTGEELSEIVNLLKAGVIL